MRKTVEQLGKRGWRPQYSLVLALLILCTVLSLSSPAFLTGRNILTVFRQISINAVLAIGVTYVILGGGIIHDFSFALLVGILIGTYSSIYVASPILLAWQTRRK